jgi:hypothetical protein
MDSPSSQNRQDRMRHFYAIVLLAIVSTVPIAFNACAPGFEVRKAELLSLRSVFEEPQQTPQEKLYSENCYGCHAGINFSSKKGRTSAQIKQAIATEPTMQPLQDLTSEQIGMIAAALAIDPNQCKNIEPIGRTVLQRLNKSEYGNSVRVVLGATNSPGDDFSDDGFAGGFKIEGNTAFLNQSLATFYGAPNLNGTGFQSVTLDPNLNRFGVLTNASILSSTSHNDHTSIIRRGKWVLDNLLCDPPQPPPAAFPITPNQSEAQRSAGRLANRACMNCHNALDNLGFGLQNFDSIGKYRTMDEGGQTITPGGHYPGGVNYLGTSQLSKAIASDPRFAFCVTKKMLTFATGREIRSNQICTVKAIAEKNIRRDSKLSDLIGAIVESDLFRKQQGVPQ